MHRHTLHYPANFCKSKITQNKIIENSCKWDKVDKGPTLCGFVIKHEKNNSENSNLYKINAFH